MVVWGSAISDKPEPLIIMDPVLRDFFAVEGYILIPHEDEILLLVLSRLVCWDILQGTCLASYGFIFCRVVEFLCHQADQVVSLVTSTVNLPFTKVNLVFQGTYIGTMHLAPQKTMELGTLLHPRRVGHTVPKLGYTNFYRTHSSHLSANGDVLNGMRSVSWQAQYLVT